MINASRMKLRDAWILGLSVCVPAHWGLAEEPLAPDPGAVCASLQARAHAWESTQKSNPDAARQLALPCSKELAMTAKNCAVFSAATSKCQQRCKPKCRDLGSMTCSACLQETNDDCIEDQQEKIQEITESMEAVYDASQKCRFLDCTLAMRYHSQKRESPYRERCLECEAWALDPLLLSGKISLFIRIPCKLTGR